METLSFKCPHCDAPLVFDPDTQKFRCEYCLSAFTREELEAQAAERAAQSGEKAAEETDDGMARYACSSCGAELIADEYAAAMICPYCHNPVVLVGKMEGDMRPDCIIPFQIGREEAIKRLKKWVREKKYVPRSFFSNEQIEKIAGVYFPFWRVEADVLGDVIGKATERRTWTTGNTKYTETKDYDIKRQGTVRMENLTKDALRKEYRKYVEGVRPFEMEKMEPFSPAYLSGFQAQVRDLTKEQVADEVKRDIQRYASTLMENSVSGYTMPRLDTNIEIENMRWSYDLYPVWLLTYRSKEGKEYFYAMNGQTGKVCGELPVDEQNLRGLFFKVAVPVFLIALLGVFL